MADHVELVLDARTAYAPRILRAGEQLIWEMYVASGHADREVQLPISALHARILCADAERYWFLFVALHHPYQLTATRPSRARLDEYLDTILLARRVEVEHFLTELDHGSANGALSNLLRIFVGADTARTRAGRWFGSIPEPPDVDH